MCTLVGLCYNMRKSIGKSGKGLPCTLHEVDSQSF
jgi:hypothetical protein